MNAQYFLAAVVAWNATVLLHLCYNAILDIPRSPTILQLLKLFVSFGLAVGVIVCGFEVSNRLKNI